MRLNSSDEICQIVKTKKGGSIEGVIKFYFELQQNLSKGMVKGLLTIHDPNYYLHSKRVLFSPYSELKHSAYVQTLVSSNKDIFAKQKDKIRSEASANYLVSAFLEKMNPIDTLFDDGDKIEVGVN